MDIPSIEEQGLHPPSLLSCMQCCCVLSVHAPSGWAQRELRGSWCQQSHGMFKPPIVVALRHGSFSSVCTTLRGGQACCEAEGAGCSPPPCAVPGPEEQQGCAWLVPWGAAARSAVRLEGGPLHCKRVSSRSHSEPVSFPAVSRHSG